MKRRILALGGAVVLAVAGCGNGSRHDATPPTTQPPASVSTSINPDVIPPTITVAYVDAVFKVLNHLNGDAARALVASGKVTPQVLSYLRAIYNDPLYPVEIRVFQNPDLANVKQPPGDRLTTVNHLISASAGCIFVETTSSLAAVEVDPAKPPALEYWELQPKQTDDDPNHLNPTPWAFSLNQVFLTSTTEQDPCPPNA